MSEPTIYVDRERRKVSIRDACEVMTTYWIDSGEYSEQTVFDCVAAMRWQQAEIDRLRAEIDRLRAERDRYRRDGMASAHVVIESGYCPGLPKEACRCEDCRHVARGMAEAGYLDNVTDKWWEAAEAAGGTS